jgi:sec-independent protein translocase protein TatA
MLRDIGAPELLIILFLVVLLFGVGRISKVFGELGSGIRAFRQGLQGDKKDAESGEETIEDKPKSE